MNIWMMASGAPSRGGRAQTDPHGHKKLARFSASSNRMHAFAGKSWRLGWYRMAACLARTLILLSGLSSALQASAAETVTYYYSDHQGTVLATANASGALTGTSDYRPYGTQTLGPPADGPGFTGHVNDVDSSLVYMQARYYDPTIGRFTSADPVKPTPGDFFSINRYAFVNNNPIANVDPDGMESACVNQANHCDGSNRPPSSVGEIASDVLIGAGKFVVNLDSQLHTGEDGTTLAPTSTVQQGTMVGLGIVGNAVAAEMTEGESTAVGRTASLISDDAIVCRGGGCSADAFTNGTGVSLADGKLQNVSVNSAPGASLQQLTTTIQHNKVGATTAGQVRALGGDVTAKPSRGNPYHCEMCGLTPQQAQDLFQPTVRNPNK